MNLKKVIETLKQLFCRHDFIFGFAKAGLGLVCQKCGNEKRSKVYKFNADGTKTRID